MPALNPIRARRSFSLFLILNFKFLILFNLPAHAATYYLDSSTGSDTNAGTSPTLAWKTLDRANTNTFAPGDQLLLKAGTQYTGQLAPHGSGNASNLITLASYGTGPKPRIDGTGIRDTLLLRNIEYWDIRDLEISNLGTNRAPARTGVHVLSENFGAMRHIHLSNLFVHDVNGDLRKEQEGCGIFFESRGGNASHFDDLLIENCHLLRTDRNGICQRGGRGAHSTHVIIRNNLLEDIGGDGIKLWGTDGGLVEHNTLHGGRMRCADYAAGIWPFDCNDALIQYNEVSGMRGTKDGQGFDSDYLCRRSIFQYNYSHDNDGGFILICTPGNSYNEDTIIRYNISQNDGINSARVFHFGGGARNTRVYNNTIYLGPKQDLPLLLFDDWNHGNARDTQFLNNIFYVAGHATNSFGQSTNTTFTSNIFYGPCDGLPASALTNTNRPPLTVPGTAADGTNTLTGYTPANSNFPRGQIIPNTAPHDFFGHPIPTSAPPAIGAVER